jgi:hypothetical protein
LSTDDWDAAGKAYALEHDRYFAGTHAGEDWFTEMFMGTGPEADARRARAIPLIAQDGSRVPDIMQSGPDAVPTTDEVRRLFFGED